MVRFSEFPRDLSYVSPCKCWTLQKYCHLTPSNRGYDRSRKGSLDPIRGPNSPPLKDDIIEIGEVNVSDDGMLHPGIASKAM